MNTLIFICSLVSLGCTLVALRYLLFPPTVPSVTRWMVTGSTEIMYDCGSCGSPVHTKFANETDRILEDTFCPVCGDPHRL